MGAAYLAAAFLLPTGTNVPIHDDGIYDWMAESFSRGHLAYHPASAAAALFETIWGGFLLRVFGDNLGALRWGSVLLTLAAGVAVAAAATALGVTGWWRGILTGAFLFNPLGFILSYSFMTDAHAVALGAIALACWLWSLRRPDIHLPLLAAGSVTAAMATASRQPAIALAVAASLTILVRRPIPRARAVAALAIVIVPSALTMVVDQVWIASEPAAAQSNFLSVLLDLSLSDLAIFVEQIVALHLVYVVAMLLPLASSVALFARPSWRAISRTRALKLAVFGTVAAAAVTALPGDRMPWVPSWFNSWGLGAWDLNGLPAGILTDRIRLGITAVICAVAALGAIVAFDRWPIPRALGTGELLCGFLLVTSVLCAVPSSASYESVVTLDRYLLPAALPAALLLARALRDRPIRAFIPSVMLCGIATFSITATHDSLSFHRAIARLDAIAAAAGARPQDIDAGPGLTTFRSHDMIGLAPARNPRPTWWTTSIAPAVTAEWIICSHPAPGYDIVAIEPYPTILQTKPSALYLMHQSGFRSDP